jgi:preprotein translocase subunit SecF
MNKYVFRRLLVGTIITPLVALAWCLLYVGMVVLGAGQAHTLSEIWTIGLWLGVVGSVAFALDAWGKN